MSTLAQVALEVQTYALTTTPDSQAGVSASLSAVDYLVIGIANAGMNGGTDGTDLDQTFRIGATDGSRTVFARGAGERTTFGVDAGAGTEGVGGAHPMGFAVTHSAAATDELESQAWAGSANGEAYCYSYAIPLTLIPGTGTGARQARWHSETANSDTIVDTPTTGYEEVGTTLTFTPNRAGDYLVLASAELVADGTAATTDEFDCRVTVDGTPVSGSTVQTDVGDRNTAVHGYLFMFRTNLTAASHSIAVEVNGTSSGGNVGVRRIRIHAIESAIFIGGVSYDTVAGETTPTTGDQDIVGLTFNIGNGSRDYLLLYSGVKQVSYWGECHFLLGGATETPVAGFGVAAGEDFGLAATDDLILENGVIDVAAPASSTSVEVRLTKLGGSNTNQHGSDAARTAAGDLHLLAIPLEVYDRVDGSSAGVATVTGTLTSPGAISGSSAGAATVSGSLVGDGALAGSSPGVASVSGSLTAVGSVSGSSAGVATVDGTLTDAGAGAISGTSDGAATATGTLTGVAELTTTADPLAQYDDDFIGNAFRSQWSEFLPSAVSYEIVEGSEANIAPTQGGPSGSHWFNTNDGIFRRLTTTISGGFDYRGRMRVRDAAGTSSPPTAAGEFRFAGLQVHDPNRATVYNYVHIMLGADPNGTNRVEYKNTVNSVSTYSSVAGSAPLDYDLRIVRDPAALQTFRLYYRRTDLGEPLESDTGWNLLQTFDRTADPMPAALELGWSGGYAGPQTSADIQSWLDAVRIRTGTPETASGRAVAIAEPSTGTTAASAGTSTATGALTGTGYVVGTSDGTCTVDGTLTPPAGAMVGTSDGAATTAADLVGEGALSGTSAGTCTVDGTLSLPAGAMVGTSDGASTTTAALTGSGALASTSDGLATVTAAPSGLGALAGASAGAATVTGLLTTGSAGTAAGIAAVSGTLVGAGTLAGASAGAATVSGTFIAPILIRRLSVSVFTTTRYAAAVLDG